MKILHFATRILVISIVTSVLMTASLQAADHRCSNATAAGKWGFTTNGTTPAVGPVGAVGRFSQDAAGNLVGIQTRSLNGSIADETLTGNVTVNSD